MPAYRRIALPMLGLATLALPAAATGATSGALVDRLEPEQHPPDPSPPPRRAPPSPPSARACCAPATRARDVRSLQRLLVATGIKVDVIGQLPLRDLPRGAALPGRRRPARHRRRRPAHDQGAARRGARPAQRRGQRRPRLRRRHRRRAPHRHAHPARRRHERPRRAPAPGLPAPRRRARRRPPRRRVRRRHRQRRAPLRAAREPRGRRRPRRRRHLRAVQDRRRGRQARRRRRPVRGPSRPAARTRRQGARSRSTGLAIAPEGAPDAVKKIIAAGNRIATKPYKWGGGHGRWEDSGYDCSGSVSYALRGAGLLERPLASYDFFGWGESGKGRWVTIYTNSGHAYMVVAGLRFDTSGRGANGSRWQSATRDPGAFQVRHPAGL